MKALPFPCIRPAQDRALEALPQMGDISSLNVAQASTACMYEWLRQNYAALAAE